jgi:hypothetical protein
MEDGKTVWVFAQGAEHQPTLEVRNMDAEIEKLQRRFDEMNGTTDTGLVTGGKQ